MTKPHDTLEPYYAEDGIVWKHPLSRRVEEGTAITMGFSVCKMSEWVGDDAAQAVAELMNRGHQASLENTAEESLRALTAELAAMTTERNQWKCNSRENKLIAESCERDRKAAESELARMRGFVDFVNLWCHRKSKCSDTERLSMIKFHPTAKAALPSPPTEGETTTIIATERKDGA